MSDSGSSCKAVEIFQDATPHPSIIIGTAHMTCDSALPVASCQIESRITNRRQLQIPSLIQGITLGKSDDLGKYAICGRLHTLNVLGVFQLLHLLGIPIALSALRKKSINGSALLALTCSELNEELRICRLGDRIRLRVALDVSMTNVLWYAHL